MLIEFTVANFRSIREPQTLTLAASKRSELSEDNTFDSGIAGLPRLLRSAVVYGANASGKSNLIKAIEFAKGFIEDCSKTQDGDPIPHQPFKLDPKSQDEPSTFEFIFVADAVRYQYGFAIDARRIHREWLIAYPKKVPQRWFERIFNPETQVDDWKFSGHFKGDRSTWQNATRYNALFLSIAVQLNSSALRPVFHWFREKLNIIRSGISHGYTATRCHDDKNVKKIVINFLSSADLSIDGIETTVRPVKDEDLPGFFPQTLREKLLKDMTAREVIEIKFRHGSASIELEEESDGTRKLFSLAGPWFDILERGLVVIIDELHNSLHPHIVRFLLSFINSKENNPNNAQLFFSTHETSILDTALLRRDQVWFVEKEPSGATRLYALLDFSPRQNEALEKGYLTGRYGGLPYISAWNLRGGHEQ